MGKRLQKICLYIVLVVIILARPATGTDSTATDPFPVFPSIEPNVAFWNKIYTIYSSSQGVIHDNRHLDIIYDVIDLEDPNLPGSRRTNRKRIRSTKKKYQAILDKLAHGALPSTAEEGRVAALFGPDAKRTDFQKARHRIRCQTGQRDRFREGLIRSGAYIDQMMNILRDHGLPVDLAYLPHVESSFNPDAYSKFGAAGAWQFTRSTGKLFMTIGYTLDERRDPIISTHAAARLLKSNYDKLQSWPMALTAYNHGVAGMLRAQRRVGDYEAVFKDYKSRLFKFASRNFYPEFLAAREIARNYRPYFGELDLHPPLKNTEVILAGYASLPALGKHLGIDLDVLQKLNPALRKPVFTGQKYAPKGYRLRLPSDEERDWEILMAAVPAEIYRQDQKHGRIYTVNKGDTAGEIARRHGVGLQDLIAFNNLDTRATIYVDQNLRIPLMDKQAPQTAAITAAMIMPSEKAPDEVTESVQEPTAPPDNAKPIDLWAENKRFAGSHPKTGVDDRSVEEALPSDFDPVMTAGNFIKNRTALPAVQDPDPKAVAKQKKPLDLALTKPPVPQPIQTAPEVASESPPTGSKAASPHNTALPADFDTALVRPADDGPDPSMVTGRLSVDRVMQNKGRLVGIITVEIEETLGHYAEWLKVRASDLRRLNNMRYGQYIHVGQKLRIPLHRVTKEAFEEMRFEYHKELVEDFFSAYRVDGIQIYSIKRGDNIWTLSRNQFELPLWLIRRYNRDTDFTSLVPSQSLRIPVVEKAI